MTKDALQPPIQVESFANLFPEGQAEDYLSRVDAVARQGHVIAAEPELDSIQYRRHD